MTATNFVDDLRWNEAGLIPAIAQDHLSGEILMMAWMNIEALTLTVSEGRAVYWSRSREKLWRKGEESGNTQTVHDIRLDCDRDVILLKVEQHGNIACHTGRRSCFFNALQDGRWTEVDPVLNDPTEMYNND
ncbi:MAG: phosphoribosyl-AMP cyclohydrolase [Halieaceae bacterium]|jgi:phosphoribosyl-AMP cyclohydrolase